MRAGSLPYMPAPKRHTGLRMAATATLTLMLVGCAAKLPQPSRAVGDALRPPYLIKVGDSLEVRFYNAPEMNIEVPVRSDGKISLELLGDVQAAGVEPEELSRTLTRQYAFELNKPRVTVVVRSFGGEVYVGGEVKAPSVLPFGSGLTALQAINAAGGFLATAKVNSVILIRRNGGEFRGYRLALHKLISGKDLSADVPLQPSDILHVPMSKVGNVNKFMDLYIRKNIPISPPLAAGF